MALPCKLILFYAAPSTNRILKREKMFFTVTYYHTEATFLRVKKNKAEKLIFIRGEKLLFEPAGF